MFSMHLSCPPRSDQLDLPSRPSHPLGRCISRGSIYRFLIAFLVCVWLQPGFSAQAQTFFERKSDWPDDLRIAGTLVACDTNEALLHFLDRELEVQSRRPLATASIWIVVGNLEDERIRDRLSRLSTEIVPCEPNAILEVLQSPADAEQKDAPYKNLLWCTDPREATELHQLGEMARNGLRAIVDRGGIACCVGALTDQLGKWAVATDDPVHPFRPAWNLLPDGLLVWRDRSNDAWEPTYRSQITPEMRCVAIECPSNHAVVLRGRKLSVLGKDSVSLFLPAAPHLSSREHVLRERQRDNSPSPEAWMADWTQWRRDAMERTLPPFPPTAIETPMVENGTLMIVGGGGLPEGLMQRFVQCAGGEDARLVYIPCLEEEDASREQNFLNMWKRLGVENCSMLHTKNRNQADTDAAFYEPLQHATGIWFGGGRQWNFADSYYGTTTHRLMKDVLKRGGVIGGSSAGASIQGSYLARATPIDNVRIMAPGYERGGLGFLLGVAIDQHFTQRNRHPDLRSLVRTYPQLLGIGIDETTAMVVQGSRAEVVGRGSVFFMSAVQPDGTLDPQSIQEVGLQAGGVYDLKSRRASEEPVAADR